MSRASIEGSPASGSSYCPTCFSCVCLGPNPRSWTIRATPLTFGRPYDFWVTISPSPAFAWVHAALSPVLAAKEFRSSTHSPPRLLRFPHYPLDVDGIRTFPDPPRASACCRLSWADGRAPCCGLVIPTRFPLGFRFAAPLCSSGAPTACFEETWYALLDRPAAVRHFPRPPPSLRSASPLLADFPHLSRRSYPSKKAWNPSSAASLFAFPPDVSFSPPTLCRRVNPGLEL